MRHCNKNCTILPYVMENQTCPILGLKKTRKQSEWHFVKDGEKLVPLCEEKHSRTGKKGLMVL